MTAEEIFDKAEERIFDRLGKDAVFTPAVGDPVSCKVNLEKGSDFQPGGLDAQVWGSETSIEYRLAEVGKEADRDEVFTVGGTDYTVKDVMENDGRFVKVAVKSA
ncbi:MAG: hypothetical protein JRF53_00590 [Deltaproteobacteria bacterium]|nr:hypothetical protein [Deltaproteobacteria bacterium]